MYQLAYSQLLSWTSGLVAASLLEEEVEGQFKLSLEVCAWMLSLLRLVNLSAILSAILGLVGLQRESIPLIRLFTLHTAFDILLSGLLTFVIALVTLPSSSATKFCDSFANSDILSDLVGTGGIESCEERWDSVTGMFVVGAFLISGVRLWGLRKCLEGLSKRQRRRGPSLSINTAAAAASRSGGVGGGGERFYTDHPGSTTNSKRPRIFLLPTPQSSSTATPKPLEHSIPLLSLTPSSPADTFPPTHPQFPPPPPPSSPLNEDTTPTALRQSEPSYIVYAPIPMTAEEARKLSASEVVFHGGGRARSHSQAQSPLTALAGGGTSESPMKLA